MMNKTNTQIRPNRTTQRGVALITGLIFMVVLTLLVVAAMRTTILEEKMAGNARDINLAFQSAEAALRAGEQILNGASLPAFASTGSYLTQASRDDAYWLSTHNWTTDSVPYGSVPNGVAVAPSFVVEELASVPIPGFSKKAGPLAETGYFKVTARGVGGNSNTLVLVQSTYRR